MNLSEKKILVVDDIFTNLQLIVEILMEEYKVIIATNGKRALEIVSDKAACPDLILLDIMMPEMDGYEVCQKLKENPDTKDIPVLFLTAMNDVASESKGLKLGAVDYITKPIVPDLLRSRVKTHLSLYEARLRLEAYNKDLEEEVAKRTEELAEANKELVALDKIKKDFLYVISHELRTPANGILGISEILFNETEESDELIELKQAYDYSKDRLMNTIDDILLLAELQSDHSKIITTVINVSDLFELALKEVKSFAIKNKISIVLPEAVSIEVRGNQKMLLDSLTIFLKMAIKLSLSSKSVVVSAWDGGDGYIMLSFVSTGRDLSQEDLSSFLEIFSPKRASSHIAELGLSVPLASTIISLMGGCVSSERVGRDKQELIISIPKSS